MSSVLISLPELFTDVFYSFGEALVPLVVPIIALVLVFKLIHLFLCRN